MKGQAVRRVLRTSFFVVLLLSVIPACSSKKTAVSPTAKARNSAGESAGPGPAAPRPAGREASVSIKPVDADHTSVLRLSSKGLNMSGAEIEWIVNGVPVAGADGPVFKADETAKGDEVRAKVTVNGREIESNTVEIHDSPPKITGVSFMPKVFRPGDRLRVDVSTADSDGDDVTLQYQWTKNGDPAGDGSEIEGQLRRGDKIEVRIVPSDGEMEGRPVVLKREIANMPPMIDQGGKFNFDGTVCTYQVRATDPDGDPLTYSLKDAPSDMTIDPQTGAIRWVVPPDFTGKASFTAVVKDGHGGRSSQLLTFRINKPSK